VGDGLLRKKLEEYSKKNHLTKNISFLGKVDDIRPTMRTADLYVRPSLTDGIPYGAMEAMASGLPVIASKIAGTTDLLTHEKTGYLVKPGNINDLANAIINLLSNPDKMEDIAKKGLELVEKKYSWETVYENYENFYLNLVKNQ